MGQILRLAGHHQIQLAEEKFENHVSSWYEDIGYIFIHDEELKQDTSW